MYPQQGAKRSSLRALLQDLSNQALNYLTWLWTVWRFFFLLSTMIWFKTSVKNHKRPSIWATAQLCLEPGLGQVCELFQKPKFLTWWNSFPTCLLTEDGKARQGKAKQDQDAVPLGQKWVEHLVTEIATKMLLPALEKQLFKAGSIASPLCRCCHLDVACANNISSWKKTSRNDSTALVYPLPKERNQLISRNGRIWVLFFL